MYLSGFLYSSGVCAFHQKDCLIQLLGIDVTQPAKLTLKFTSEVPMGAVRDLVLPQE